VIKFISLAVAEAQSPMHTLQVLVVWVAVALRLLETIPAFLEQQTVVAVVVARDVAMVD